MKTLQVQTHRALAIYPMGSRFGYAVFEGDHLLDWAVLGAGKDKRAGTLTRVAKLMDRYTIDVVVTEHARHMGRRSNRIKKLVTDVRKLAQKKHARWTGVTRNQVTAYFGNAGESVTKYVMAELIAARYDELAPRLPPRRKPWTSEDQRMAIFEAVAMALIFCARE